MCKCVRAQTSAKAHSFLYINKILFFILTCYNTFHPEFLLLSSSCYDPIIKEELNMGI